MMSEAECQSRRLPTLVTYCQRGELSIDRVRLYAKVIVLYSPLYIHRLCVPKMSNNVVRD